MHKYDHKKIEKKWQNIWEKKGVYHADDKSKKPKYYTLIEFPYPSGDGLHVGHPRPYIGMDVISRKRRMQGYNVLYPIGWDAFGLPTENYAIKTGKDPRVVTKKNTDTFRKQIKSLGVSFDWSREINTTDPKYYKWTQWIFLQFYKKGLAYKAKMTINWCPKDKIGLANEEVINGCCERCGTPVEKREKEQWMLGITKYAERLDKDLDTVDYLPQIKIGQRNWIGKSVGAEIEFKISSTNESIKVFTTRPDTIFGATFIALAPEVAKKITGKDFGIKVDTDRENKEKIGIDTGLKAKNPASGEQIPVFVVNYVSADYGTGAIMGVPAHDERDFEFAKKYNLPIIDVVIPIRVDNTNPHISGKKIVERKAVQAIIRNPKNGKILCLNWKAHPWTTFVVGGVEKGEDILEAARREVLEETGYKNIKFIRVLGGQVRSEFFAAHKDENRVAYFNAILFELENEDRIEVSREEIEKHEVVWKDPKDIRSDTMQCGELDIWLERLKNENAVNAENGILTNSGKFNGMDSENAKKEIIKFVGVEEKTTFKLRDWIFSRQRYWGEPIPIIHCSKCGMVPVPEKDLPVELPKVKNYQPTDSGESPLANISKWVNVKCPKCKGGALRETDTMPNWAGSSWYYLRYTDPKNKNAFADKKNLKYWTPVDWYNGGNEHTTLHLLYSRFWHKFLYDLKLVPTSEPYMKRTSHGMILGEGGVKMSKSVGNVINPNEIVKIYGADTMRVYEMFMGPFDQSVAWSDEAIIGPRRFLEKVWKLGELVEKNSVRVGARLRVKRRDFSLPDSTIAKLLNKTIKKVSEDIEAMHFNTAISAMMILATEMQKSESVSEKDFKMFLQILAPFAPHITEDLWQTLGEKKSIDLSVWPKWDENLIQDEEVTIIVQVNGKVRGQFKASVDISEAEAKSKAENLPEVRKWITTGVKRFVFIPRKLINIVV
ncbi:MAG: class I tRNA ligase family protein [Patescibacteria group bacterium]|nr:class I tRNA ligase family protein [Patescibacteria group bacterium]